MKNPEQNRLIKDWLCLAKENLLFAKAGMKEDFSPFHTICYLCQGGSEKYLKAFLLWKGWELKKIHDLSDLLNFCCEYDKSFETLYPKCESLNEYITEGRYPGDMPFESIGKDNAMEAIEASETIEKFVLQKIKLKGYPPARPNGLAGQVPE